MLAAMPKAKGTRGQLVSRGVIGSTKSEPPINQPPTLDALGITKRLSSEAQKLGEMLATMPSAAGQRTDLVTSGNQVAAVPTLKSLGISKRLSSEAQKLGEMLAAMPKAKGTRGQLVSRGVIERRTP